MPESALNPAIEHLERKVNALVMALNVLRAEASLPPYSPSPDGGGPGQSGSLDIKADTFFNKRQHTAVRQYLKMRYTHNLGPATPTEIFAALKKGGYRHDAKDDETAKVGLRALLRRRTNVFVKVGDTGAYGLVSQYPDAKPKIASRVSEEDSDEAPNSPDEDNEESTAAEHDAEATAA